MTISIYFDESAKTLKVEGPAGVPPSLVISLLSQAITALAAANHGLIVPVAGFQVKSS